MIKTPRLLKLFKVARLLRILKLLRIFKIQKLLMKVNLKFNNIILGRREYSIRWNEFIFHLSIFGIKDHVYISLDSMFLLGNSTHINR
jgi:hypothetical protein